jgi:hypothetical protein
MVIKIELCSLVCAYTNKIDNMFIYKSFDKKK